MATLTDDELARIRAELLDNVLDNGATPYFNVRSVYDVIRDHVAGSDVAATTSASAVTAAGPTTITLASATGYAAGQRIQLDADAARETVTIRSLSGAVASVVCAKTHSGTYPVEVESALTLVRGTLADLAALEQVSTQAALGALGIKRVDEVEFFGTADGGSVAASVAALRASLRRELAARVGLSRLLAASQGGPSSFEVY